MKIKTLTIHNIASIEDATIDFTGPELGDSDLFLICGPTGAGKSTILDAICMALFDDTPRLAYSDKKEEIDAFYEKKNDTIKDSLNLVKSSLHLVRKNAVDAHVILTFEAEGREYTATWMVTRANQYTKGRQTAKFSRMSLEQKLSRNIQKKWTLTDDRGLSDEKPAAAIRDVIKMDLDRFCKTTMLAQGDFTRFLKSSADDKAKILEVLLHTDIYRRTGAQINEITLERKKDLEMLERELANFRFLNDEEKAAIQAETDGIDNRLAEIAALRAGAEAKLRWIDTSDRARAAALQSAQALERATEQAASPEIAGAGRRLRLWDSTQALREALAARDTAARDAAANGRRMRDLAGMYTEGAAGLAHLRARAAALRQAVDGYKKILEPLERFAPMLLNAQTICEKHRAVLANERFLADSAPESARLDSLSSSLGEKLAPLQERKDKAMAEAERMEAEAAGKDAAISELGAATIAAEKAELDRGANALTALESSIRLRDREMEEHRRRRAAVTACAEAESKAADDAAKAGEKAKEDRSRADETGETYRKTHASVSNHAQILRKDLRPGDVCPVCRNIVERIFDEKALEELLRPVEERLKADDARARASEQAHADAKARHQAAVRATAQARQELQAASRALDKAVAEAREACRALHIEYADDLTDAIIGARAGVDEARALIKEREDKIESLRRQVREIHRRQADLRKNTLAPLEKEMEGLRREIDKALRDKAQLDGSMEKARATIARTKTEIAGLTDPEWKPDGPEDYLTALEAAAARYTATLEALGKARAEADTVSRDMDVAESCENDVDALFPQLRGQAAPEPRELERPATVWTDIKAEAASLAEAIADTAARAARAAGVIDGWTPGSDDGDIAAVEALMSLDPGEVARMRRTVEDAARQMDKARALHDEALRALEACADSPLADGDTRETLDEAVRALDDETRQRAQRKGQLAAEIEADARNRELMGRKKKEYDETAADYAGWKELDNYLGSTGGKNFRKVAQSFVLTELLDKANVYLENITSRYTLFCHPGTLTIMMRDSFQGGIERPTNTLSGGESFIISLALALGLSSLQNAGMEVDTLFIDEGFGTLSPEFIDPVVTALKRLHSVYGRRVGIISHVEGLRGRIGATIEVRRHGTSASRVIVSGA